MRKLIALIFIITSTSHAESSDSCRRFPLNISTVISLSEQGDTYCQSVLALEYERGTSGEKDEAKARYLALKAASAGDALGIYLHASFYLWGERGFPKDPDRAATMYRKALDHFESQTSADAHYLLAQYFIYSYGRAGGDKNEALGCEFARRAADLGHPHGMYRYSMCLKRKLPKGQTSDSFGSTLLRAAQAGSPHAIWDAAELYVSSSEEREAIEILSTLVDHGTRKDLFKLGMRYEGYHFSGDHISAAVEAYKLAHRKGSGRAALRLGWIFYEGDRDGIDRDEELSLHFFQEAQRLGVDDAARALSVLFGSP